MGGGGFTAGSADPALDELVLRPDAGARARASACCPPRAATPSIRSAASTRRTATACASRPTFHCSASGVSLFQLREHLLSQDAIYVGGGSMVNLLAIWKAQGLDVILREAWQAGVVLAGLSAGSMCWFEWGVTTSSGHAAPAPGLGFLPGLQLGPPRQRAGAPPGLPRGGRAAARSRPGTPSTTAPRWSSAAPPLSEVVSARAGARAYAVTPDGESAAGRPRHLTRAHDAAGRDRRGRAAAAQAVASHRLNQLSVAS